MCSRISTGKLGRVGAGGVTPVSEEQVRELLLHDVSHARDRHKHEVAIAWVLADKLALKPSQLIGRLLVHVIAVAFSVASQK